MVITLSIDASIVGGHMLLFAIFISIVDFVTSLNDLQAMMALDTILLMLVLICCC